MQNKWHVGSTWKPRLTGTVPAGTAFDFTSYTCYWAMKRSTDSSAAYIIPKTAATGSLGYIDATILDTVTDDVPPGKYLCEFHWEIGTGASKVVGKHQYQREVYPRLINT